MALAVPVALGLLITTGLSCAQVAAQELSRPAVWGAPPTALSAADMGAGAWRWRSPGAPLRMAPQLRPPHPATATAFSALLPGAGQHLLGQRRAWAYLTLEAVGWALYIDRHSAGGDLRNEYRDFAWDRARTQNAVRVDGSFGYYETLSKWERSGQFDVDAQAPGVQPESDVTAFNGRVWALATQLFFSGAAIVPVDDPRYQRALEFYRDRAFSSDFLWDWTGTGSAKEDFGALIRRSDERFRQAKNVVGALIANHVLSAVDAYFSSRGVRAPVQARIVPELSAGRTRWLASISIATHQ